MLDTETVIGGILVLISILTAVYIILFEYTDELVEHKWELVKLVTFSCIFTIGFYCSFMGLNFALNYGFLGCLAILFFGQLFITIALEEINLKYFWKQVLENFENNVHILTWFSILTFIVGVCAHFNQEIHLFGIATNLLSINFYIGFNILLFENVYQHQNEKYQSETEHSFSKLYESENKFNEIKSIFDEEATTLKFFNGSMFDGIESSLAPVIEEDESKLFLDDELKVPSNLDSNSNSFLYEESKVVNDHKIEMINDLIIYSESTSTLTVEAECDDATGGCDYDENFTPKYFKNFGNTYCPLQRSPRMKIKSNEILKNKNKMENQNDMDDSDYENNQSDIYAINQSKLLNFKNELSFQKTICSLFDQEEENNIFSEKYKTFATKSIMNNDLVENKIINDHSEEVEGDNNLFDVKFFIDKEPSNFKIIIPVHYSAIKNS